MFGVQMGVHIGGPYWGSIFGVHIGGQYWGSILGVHIGGSYWVSQIRASNRGPKSGSQIGLPNRGPILGSQIGVPNWPGSHIVFQVIPNRARSHITPHAVWRTTSTESVCFTCIRHQGTRCATTIPLETTPPPPLAGLPPPSPGMLKRRKTQKLGK
jgi:hypothetical protein